MGLEILNKLFGKSKTPHKEKPEETPITIPVDVNVPIRPKLDLSKRIGLNFEKMNLNDPEVINKRLFLLDTSGSMVEKVDGKSKILHLRNIMEKYTTAKMLCFSSNVVPVTNSWEILEPDGGTNLAKALKYIKSEDKYSPERIVLISDGQPDSEEEALNQAKLLALPIDIIFIGNKGSHGELFMEKLAKQTDGKHFNV